MSTRDLVVEFVTAFAINRIACHISMEFHWAWRKYRGLGDLIQLCDPVRPHLDLEKITGNQRNIKVSPIEHSFIEFLHVCLIMVSCLRQFWPPSFTFPRLGLKLSCALV